MTFEAKAKAKAKATGAKAKAIGPEAKAKAKTIKLASRRLEAKAWPRGLHHWKILLIATICLVKRHRNLHINLFF